MTINISPYLFAPVMLPYVQNLFSTKFYKKPPKYFWWLVLKKFPHCDIFPKIEIKPSRYAPCPSTPFVYGVYDVSLSLVHWVFDNVRHPYYLIFDKEYKVFKFYFTDKDEALWFKLMFG